MAASHADKGPASMHEHDRYEAQSASISAESDAEQARLDAHWGAAAKATAALPKVPQIAQRR